MHSMESRDRALGLRSPRIAARMREGSIRLYDKTRLRAAAAVRSESTWTSGRAARSIKRSPMSGTRLAANVFAGLSLPVWVFDLSDSSVETDSSSALRLIAANRAAVACLDTANETELRSASTDFLLPSTLNAIASAGRRIRDGDTSRSMSCSSDVPAALLAPMSESTASPIGHERTLR